MLRFVSKYLSILQSYSLLKDVQALSKLYFTKLYMYKFILVLQLTKVLGVVESEGVCVLSAVAFLFADLDRVSKRVATSLRDGGSLGVCLASVAVARGVLLGLNFTLSPMPPVVNTPRMIPRGVAFSSIPFKRSFHTRLKWIRNCK